MFRRTALVCLLVTLMFAVQVVAAGNENLPVASPKVKTLAAFKNGLGFVFRTGKTDLNGGWAVIGELPQASTGTLWIGTTAANARVDEVLSYKATDFKETDAISTAELLEANVGKRVTVIYTAGASSEPRSADGVVVAVPRDRTPETSPNYQPNRYVEPPRGQVVLLKIYSGQTLAINKSSIISVVLPENASLSTALEREVNRAKVHVSGNPNSAELTMAYLQKGVIWSPSYLINIKDPKQADITMEAVLVNDVEDLEDVDVSFVVGYPNFMFSDTVTPLSAMQSVTAFMQSLSGQSSPRSTSHGNVMAQSMVYNYAAYDSSAVWRPENNYATGEPLPGESNEDLYFYKQEHVTLKKGERAKYTVFTSRVPYEHVYEWTIPDSSEIDDRGNRLYNSSNKPKEEVEQVWHSLRLENNTNQPWTTAPAFAVNSSMPVAQDVLKYTPPGGKNNLKLTVATDVRAEQSQLEESREMVKLGNSNYDSVTVNGTLKVMNFKKQPVKMIVTKTIKGEVLQVGQEGKIARVAKKLEAVNPQSEVEWVFDLAPGAEKVIDYKYKVLVGR